MATQREIDQWLQEGIVAAKNGQHEQARFRLLDVVEQNQTNETAWYWLYQLFDHNEDKRVCLENLVVINPNNEWARNELLNYLDRADVQQVIERAIRAGNQAALAPEKNGVASSPARPITLKLMIAFWTGIATTLLGGGLVALTEWLVASTRSRSFPDYITVFQAFDLLLALLFMMAGIMSLLVALLLFYRSMLGFYGSIVLALGLLLIGPIVSLITDPPNYLTMICTGGISGVIVFLTLASQPGFKH